MANQNQKKLDINVQQGKQKYKLAMGTVNLFPSRLGERLGLNRDTQTINIPKDFKNQVKLARNIYYNEAVVGTVIDLMIDFATTGMENISDDPEAKEFFDKLCKYSDMDTIHRWIFWEYLISGDVFILRGEGQKVKSGKDKGATYFPFTVLNPINIQVIDSLLMGKEIIGIIPNQEFINLYNDRRTRNSVLSSLPKEVRAVIRKEEFLGTQSIIPLPEELTSRISRKKQPYQRFATPFLTRIFEPVLIKRAMREADMATAEGLVNCLVTVTEGDKEFPTTDGRLRKLAALFSNPSKTKTLFWNHTLKVEYHRPDVDIFTDDKYSQLNRDIMDGLGVTGILISGGGSSNFSTAWVSVMALIERLQSVRNQVRRWQELEYRRIADSMGLKFKNIPKVRLHKINLKDEKVFLTLMLNLFDRGLLPIETIQEIAGHDPEVMKRLKEKEVKEGTNKIFVPPFTPFSGQEPAGPPKPPTNKPGGPGRPNTNNDSNYSKRSQPKPKGQEQATLEDEELEVEGGLLDGEFDQDEERKQED